MAGFWILLLALFGLSSTANSQATLASSLSLLPSCAAACFNASISQSSCSSTNQTCICTTVSLQAEIEQCVGYNCTIKESLTTKNATVALCGAPIRDKASSYRAVTISLTVLSGLFVIQRFAFKIYAHLELCPDDWLTLATMSLLIPTAVFSEGFLVDNGIGKDIWTLEFHQITNFGMDFFVSMVLYFAQGAVLKLAFLAFYHRIFPDPGVRRLIWFTILFDSLYGLIFCVVTAFVQCKPISYFWTMWDGEHTGECLNRNAIAWANASISIALDIWMLIIPLHQLKKLQLHWKKKLGVALMFSIGSLFTVISILRLRSLVKFRSDSTNPTWEYYDAARWSLIEVNVGIICVCLPTARLLLNRVFPRFMGSSASGSYPIYNDDYNRSRKANYAMQGSKVDTKVDVELREYATPRKGILCSKAFSVETDETRLV